MVAIKQGDLGPFCSPIISTHAAGCGLDTPYEFLVKTPEDAFFFRPTPSWLPPGRYRRSIFFSVQRLMASARSFNMFQSMLHLGLID